MDIVAQFFLGLGVFFVVLGALGILRMPDVYNRLQAGTKATTLGFLSVLLGVALLHPLWIPKLAIIGIFLLLTAPISSHNLARAAHRLKVPCSIAGGDQLAESRQEDS